LYKRSVNNARKLEISSIRELPAFFELHIFLHENLNKIILELKFAFFSRHIHVKVKEAVFAFHSCVTNAAESAEPARCLP
jgi:hypothetical protein